MTENSIKSRLLKMSDMELYELIYKAATASGIPKERAQSLTADIPRLRRMLASLSDEQIRTVLASMGADANGFMGGKGNG